MNEKMPNLKNGNIGSKETIKPNYTALFVKDISSLVQNFPPRHSRIYGHHSTIAFKPASLDGIDVGAEAKIKIIGRAQDEKGDALLVENLKSKNKYPHITLSCEEGVSPVYSNELIENAIASNSIEYFTEPIEVDVVEGYSDGKNDIITPQQ